MVERPDAAGPDLNLVSAAVAGVMAMLDLPPAFDPLWDDCLEVRDACIWARSCF
jgi:hypothetical protein